MDEPLHGGDNMRADGSREGLHARNAALTPDSAGLKFGQLDAGSRRSRSGRVLQLTVSRCGLASRQGASYGVTRGS